MMQIRVLVAVVVLSTVAIPNLQAQTKVFPYKPAANAGEAVQRIEDLGGFARRVSLKSEALEVDFRNSAVADAHLQYLHLLKNVEIVRLGETSISDDGLMHLAQITTLKRLYLEKSAITDTGLRYLAELKKLEFLNLYGTKITGAGLENLKTLSKLKSLIVTETKVSSAGIAKLKSAIVGIEIIPDPLLERQSAEAAWKIAKSALEEAEKQLRIAKKEASELAPKLAQLKKEFEELRKKSEAQNKTVDRLRRNFETADRKSKQQKNPAVVEAARVAKKAYDDAQAARQLLQKMTQMAQRRFQTASNAKRNVEYAQQRLESCQTLEADARKRLDELQHNIRSNQ